MAILIDSPRWPAHGTLWGHLVSDDSLEELHWFADRAGLPGRGFDHDHYDVPAARYEELLDLGAEALPSAELARRLLASGLRVRSRERKPKAAAVLPQLRAAWAGLAPGHEALGESLLKRWSQPHRHYHDVRHLQATLESLEHAVACGPIAPEVRFAAWFHDAVYAGVAGADEEASAQLAEAELPRLGLRDAEVEEVARLVRLTAHHSPEEGDSAGELLVDADLSILAAIPGRYDMYVRDVRLEHPHVGDEAFREGRTEVLGRLRALDPVYRTQPGQRLWQDAAQANLARERRRWQSSVIRLHPAGADPLAGL